MNRQEWTKILKELNELVELHEMGVADPKKCREFNSRASIFLNELEGLGAFQIADSMMDMLCGCSPKDFSPCDNRLRTKGSLERLRERTKDSLEKG